MSSGTTDSDLDSPVDGKALSRIKTRTGLGGHLAYGDKSKHAVQDYTDALADSVSTVGLIGQNSVCLGRSQDFQNRVCVLLKSGLKSGAFCQYRRRCSSIV